MTFPGIKVGIILLAFCSALSHAEEVVPASEREVQVQLLAPGYGALNFPLPKAGSYSLPAFGDAADARVLNADGEYVNYHDIFKGKYTLLSFIYTRCTDVNGCPLSHLVFNRVQSEGNKIPAIADNLQLISMSFDPENDTPEILKALSQEDHSAHEGHDMSGHEGHDMSAMAKKKEVALMYLTADSVENLMPIVDDYDQTIQNQINEDGTQSENFSHILRVYLIDPELKIRNIYSVSFLHPDIIINDVKTLMMAEGMIELPSDIAALAKTQAEAGAKGVRVGASDSKEGYGTEGYETNSRAIIARKGVKADLIRVLETAPLGLPKVPVPENNPVTEEKVDLGKKLFFDRRLSLNDTFSCAMCHIAEQGYTSHEMERAVGVEGRENRRNTPTLYNSAYLSRLFHDGREISLENLVWDQLTGRNEMAMTSIGQVIDKIRGIEDYQGLFEKAFDGREADVLTIGQALASYQRVLVSGNSSFDRWYYGKEQAAISEQAARGFELFKGKANCIACHSVEEDHALFMDNKLHNTGIGFNVAYAKAPETERMNIAPGVYIDVKRSIVDKFKETIGDLGYYEVTQDPDDRWKYRTPTLRNIALTAPYMHNGSIPTLKDVVAIYNQGGYPDDGGIMKNVTQSPLINPLNLTEQEAEDLVAFLKTLTGDNIEEVISDAFSTPVGDTQH